MANKKLTFLVCLFALPVFIFGYHELSLDGDDWIGYDAALEHVVKSRVPGSIHTDLHRNGTIGDPYFTYNDVEYAWIGQRDWTFEKHFDVTDTLLTYTNITLRADGIDTICDVYLNKILIGSAQNMHVGYTWPVRQLVTLGSNTVKIACKSPVQSALTLSKQYPYVVPPECPPDIQNGQCHVNFLRKEASSFSWDWGPSFPTVGIWRSLTLVGYNNTFIEHVIVKPARIRNNSSIKDDDWQVQVELYLHGNLTKPASVHFVATELAIDSVVPLPTSSAKFLSVGFHVPQRLVSLWWPNGYGAATLYTMNVTLYDCPNKEESVCNNSAACQTLSKSFGFRTIEIRQLLVDSANVSSGLTFKFYINDVFVWIKGSNWIPANAFNELVSAEYTQQLLGDAQSVHMNMLRVWGGGRYQSDVFYDTCDRLGIMIWHDFMFACAMYPTDTPFLNNVREEIHYQLKRLATHAAIVLWAGNNENEVAIAQHWYPVIATNPKRYAVDYELLYNQTIWDVVRQYERSDFAGARPFVPSSPSDGPASVASPYMLNPNPQSWLYGDVHFYSYFTDPWDTNTFPKPRFVSEFGIQSWPSGHTLRSSAGSEMLAWFSKFVLHRQHAPNGQASMLHQISLHFSVPGLPARNASDVLWTKLVYLSQLNQATGIRAQVEHYRSLRDRLVLDKNNNKVGLTAGAMYWQLNQIWPAPSWSSLEFGGRWKMLHYFAAKFYAPVLIRAQISRSQSSSSTTGDDEAATDLNNKTHDFISVDIISDVHDAALHGTLKIQLYSWQTGLLQQAQAQVVVTVAAGSTASNDSLLAPTDYKPEDCVARLTYNFTRTDSSAYEVSENFLLLASFYTPQVLPQVQLHITNASLSPDGKTLAFTISKSNAKNASTLGVAAFVFLESPVDGRFSDNAFIMFDDSTKLEFYVRDSVTKRDTTNAQLMVEDFVRTLNVTTLADVIQ